MRGHEQVLEMRLIDRVTPTAIFVHDCALVDMAYECENGMPSVGLSKSDVMQSLDLRFLMGCEVHAVFHDEQRAKEFFERAQQFKPNTLVSCVVYRDKLDAHGDLWMGIYSKEKGVING